MIDQSKLETRLSVDLQKRGQVLENVQYMTIKIMKII